MSPFFCVCVFPCILLFILFPAFGHFLSQPMTDVQEGRSPCLGHSIKLVGRRKFGYQCGIWKSPPFWSSQRIGWNWLPLHSLDQRAFSLLSLCVWHIVRPFTHSKTNKQTNTPAKLWVPAAYRILGTENQIKKWSLVACLHERIQAQLFIASSTNNALLTMTPHWNL